MLNNKFVNVIIILPWLFVSQNDYLDISITNIAGNSKKIYFIRITYAFTSN